MPDGTIIKGIGGFYYVRDRLTDEVVCCRMRGAVRLTDITPAVGDNVSYITNKNGEAAVTDIKERKSYITRPPCANVSQSVIVMSLKRPDINLTLLDKLLCDNEARGLKSIICLNKTDLDTPEHADIVSGIYKDCGYSVIPISAKFDNDAAERLTESLRGAISVFRGVSGAGKTTLIKKLAPSYSSEIGEISKKTGRGKQTTRSSELIYIGSDTYILDTPGFSAITPETISSEDLWKYYPEFYKYSDCRFPNCMHLNEPDCSVKAALERGELDKTRYENYKLIYNELKKAAKYK